MKKLITILCLSIGMASAIAAPSDKKQWAAKTEAQKLKEVQANYKQVCDGMGEQAAAIMGMRQDNLHFVETLKLTEANAGTDSFEYIVVDAYESHYVHPTAYGKIEAVRNFANKWSMICVKSLRQ